MNNSTNTEHRSTLEMNTPYRITRRNNSRCEHRYNNNNTFLNGLKRYCCKCFGKINDVMTNVGVEMKLHNSEAKANKNNSAMSMDKDEISSSDNDDDDDEDSSSDDSDDNWGPLKTVQEKDDDFESKMSRIADSVKTSTHKKELNSNSAVKQKRIRDIRLGRVMHKFRKLPKMRMDANHRKFLFFWHIIIIFGSIGLIVKGIFISYWIDSWILDNVKNALTARSYSTFIAINSKPEMRHIYGPIIHEYGNAYTVLGGLYLVVTILYISFLGHRIPFTWPIMILITIVGLIVELSNLLVRLSPHAQLSTTQKRNLILALEGYRIRSKDPFSVALDYLSIWGKCCGITNMYNFQKYPVQNYHETVNGKLITHRLQIPPSCCNSTAYDKGTKAVLQCAKTMESAWMDNCFDVFFNHMKKLNTWDFIAWVILLVDVVIHIYIYRDMIHKLSPLIGLQELDDLEKKRKQEMDRSKKKMVKNFKVM